MLLKFFGIMMMAITMQNASASEDSKKQKAVIEARSSDAQAKGNSGSAAAPQSAQPSSAVNQLKQQAVAAVSSRLPWKASILLSPHHVVFDHLCSKK